MEKLRQAIRGLELDAETYERQVGAGRIDLFDEEDLQELTDRVNGVRSCLHTAMVAKPVVPEPEKPAEAAKGEESPV